MRVPLALFLLVCCVHSASGAVHWTYRESDIETQPGGRLLLDDLDQIQTDISFATTPVQLNGFQLGMIGTNVSPTRNIISAPPHSGYVEPAFSEGTLVSGILDAASPGYEGMSYRFTFEEPVVGFGFRANHFNGDGERVYARAYSRGVLLGEQGLIELYGGSLYDSFFGITSDVAVDELLLFAARNGTYLPDLGAAIELDRFMLMTIPEPTLATVALAAFAGVSIRR